MKNLRVYGGQAILPVRAAILLPSGYRDAGYEKVFGQKFQDAPWTMSWARRIEAAGLTAITYENEEPERDLHAALDYVRANVSERIGVLACSGHVPLALSLMTNGVRLQCAAFLYGYTFDAEEQAKQFRFAYPLAGKTIDDVSPNVPLFIARAGRDEMPGLNAALDRFIAGAIARNLPITVANFPEAAHAFDDERLVTQTRDFIVRESSAARS